MHAQTLGFKLADGQRQVKLHFELINNLIVIPVTLNGMLPLKFILDTGVRNTILTDKALSDLLCLEYPRKYAMGSPGALKSVEAYVTNNVSLEMAGVQGYGLSMLVLKEDYLELSNYMGNAVHGILGYDLFSRFIIKVNYKKRIVTIIMPEAFEARRNYQKIPIRIEDTKPYITATVIQNQETEIPLKLLIDTGASHALMLESTSDNRIKVPTSFVSSTIGRGLGGIIIGKIGRVKKLHVGMFDVHNPVTSFPDPNSYIDSLKMGKIPHNGSIGGELLSRFNVIFDFPNEKIYLKKNAFYKKEFHYNLSGLNVRAIGSKLNTFEIVEVRRGSVADEAGVKEGDVILNVNGKSATSLNLREVNGYLNLKPGKRVDLEVVRQGQRIKATFKLKDQI
jgi:hypothetical protein